MSHFSLALREEALNDFLEPSQECIKPQIIEKQNSKSKAKIEIRPDGTYLEVSGEGAKELKSAKITLNDCLACSGCVTSAETVLITAQSTEEFLSNLNTGKIVVFSISPQSRASLAAFFNLTNLQTLKKLTTFLKSLGVHHVFDTTFSREFSLMESAAEFVARYKNTIDLPLPMFASACPGWICYAEKEQGDLVLPFISTTKSPQQIMGTIVKYHFSKQINVSPEQIYHVALMPCYDKKLEASRDDFYNDILKTRDVDYVLATGEILDLLRQKNIHLKDLEETVPSLVDRQFTNISEDGMLLGMPGGSGGYLEYVYRVAAKELLGVDVDKIEYENVKRNSDLKVATLKVEGREPLVFATAYGFRHIANLMRKMRTSKEKFPYHFVEIMACPGGCLNGGGQIRAEKGKGKELLKRVEETYHDQKMQLPHENKLALQLYQTWLNGCFSMDSKTKLHTQYHRREKVTLNPLTVKW